VRNNLHVLNIGKKKTERRKSWHERTHGEQLDNLTYNPVGRRDDGHQRTGRKNDFGRFLCEQNGT